METIRVIITLVWVLLIGIIEAIIRIKRKDIYLDMSEDSFAVHIVKVDKKSISSDL